MVSVRSLAALAVSASVVVISTAAWAASPTQADFDACNQLARSQTSASASPSTSPATPPASASGTPGTAGAGTTGAGVGVAVPRDGGNVAPGTGSISGRTGFGIGASPGTTPSVPNVTSPSPGSSASGTPGTAGAGTTGAGVGVAVPKDGSGSTSAHDATLRGMATAGLNDPVYQQAYRDCMRARGF